MTDETAATLLFLTPFLVLWLGMTVAETAKTVTAIREARR